MQPTLADVKQFYSDVPEVIDIVESDTPGNPYFVVITSNGGCDDKLLDRLLTIEGQLYTSFQGEIGEWFGVHHMPRVLIADADLPNIANIMRDIDADRWQEIIDEPYG